MRPYSFPLRIGREAKESLSSGRSMQGTFWNFGTEPYSPHSVSALRERATDPVPAAAPEW